MPSLFKSHIIFAVVKPIAISNTILAASMLLKDCVACSVACLAAKREGSIVPPVGNAPTVAPNAVAAACDVPSVPNAAFCCSK